MKKLMSLLIAVACCSALPLHAADPQPDQAIVDAVMAMAKAQWAAEMKDPTNTAEQLKDLSDDYTEFNADAATRVEGKAIAQRIGDASANASEKTAASEMLNPKVQVYNGNVAILSYNFFGLTKDKDGKVTPNRAKSTRVYVKKGDKWTLVHANFGADPVPK